jgi:hypothetical protein
VLKAKLRAIITQVKSSFDQKPGRCILMGAQRYEFFIKNMQFSAASGE